MLIYNLYCFVFVFLNTIGILVIFDKYNIRDRMILLLMNIKCKFFYNLLMCRFCLEFWIMTIIYIIWISIYFFNIHQIAIPFLSVSLLQLTKRK